MVVVVVVVVLNWVFVALFCKRFDFSGVIKKDCIFPSAYRGRTHIHLLIYIYIYIYISYVSREREREREKQSGQRGERERNTVGQIGLGTTSILISNMVLFYFDLNKERENYK